MIFLNFWGDYARFNGVTEASLWSVLPNLFILFLAFLIAASALPDEWEGKLDLWQYHLGSCRQFWVLVAIAGVAVNVYDAATNWPPRTDDYVGTAVTLIFAGVLCVTKRWWIHLVLTSAFFLIVLAGSMQSVIKG